MLGFVFSLHLEETPSIVNIITYLKYANLCILWLLIKWLSIRMCRREVVSGSAEFLFCMGFHERLQERWCFIRFPCYVGYSWNNRIFDVCTL
ncbi:hypothetical protein TSPI_00411 [Trichinella spiralis]|uniref:Uncharacterized protein n=1 Tax=Trichinella spiralis TaxID=6334 RepID=A0ABR3KVT6_TRISP